MFHGDEFGAFFIGQGHNRADERSGNKNPQRDNRLFNVVDMCGVGEFGRIIDHLEGAVGHDDFVNNGRHGGNQLLAVFAFQPFEGDFHVQHAHEAEAVTPAEGGGTFLFEDNRRIVELEFFQRGGQFDVIVGVDGINTAEHHRLRVAEAGNAFGFRMFGGNNRIADVDTADFFNDGADITDIAGGDDFGGGELGCEITDFVHVVNLAGGFNHDFIAVLETAGKDADVRNDAAVGIVK